MVTASIYWWESNTASTDNFDITGSNTNWGNTNSTALDAAANPINAGSCSFEKWQRFSATINDSYSVHSFRVYMSAPGALPANASLWSNATSGAATGTITVWETPAATDDHFVNAVTTSDPGVGTLGIGGTKASTASIASGGASLSDWFVHGIVTDAAVTTGTTGIVLTAAWTEVT